MFSASKPLSGTIARGLKRLQTSGHRRTTRRAGLAIAAFAITGIAAATVTAGGTANHTQALAAGTTNLSGASSQRAACVSTRPARDFYEAGRVASVPLTVPDSGCTTISVSDIQDPAVPADRCQTFLVGFFPADGSAATYTEPVTACAIPPRTRTVLASDVPDGAVYRVLYNVDYINPSAQVVR